MTKISFGHITEFYPYRTANVRNRIFSCELNSMEIDELRKRIESRGYKFDNHICWRTAIGCFMYSDNILYVCGDLIIERW